MHCRALKLERIKKMNVGKVVRVISDLCRVKVLSDKYSVNE